MEKLYIRQIKEENFLDYRSDKDIKKWLQEHNIPVQYNKNKPYVNKLEFEYIYEKPMVIELKRQYPNHWREAYSYLTNQDREGFFKFKDSINTFGFSEKYNSQTYQPVSKAAKDFLAEISH